ARVKLIEADLFSYQFEPGRFDLVYSVGVLAEHTPFDEHVVAKVARWLKGGGRFAFTTVHPESPSIPRTLRRFVGERLAPMAARRIGARLRERLLAGGMYADESRVRSLLEATFDVESLDRFESEAHLHCLCVAGKRSA